MSTRKDLFRTSCQEYRQAGKKERGVILDRLTETTGMNRDYLATVLRNYGRKVSAVIGGKAVAIEAGGRKKPAAKKRERGKRGGRPVKYGEEFVKTLTVIWEEHGLLCGKLLAPYIRSTIDFLAEEPKYGITEDIYRLLLDVSPAEADILLAPARKAREIKGVSTTRAASQSLRAQVPVQTHFNRETVLPGQFAFDTAAHCGGTAKGQFCKTLTGTDVYSGWVEERPLLNGANKWVFEAFSNIKTELPFPLLGGHFDNGVEFINKPLIEQCKLWNIAMTRSRPYQKNDNCFAEQKNFDVVRKNVGYFRFDTPEEADALAEAYRFLCPLNNYFLPSFKLLAKEKRADGRYKKVYEKAPKTPYQRLMESPLVSEESKKELKRRKGLYNPLRLNEGLNRAVAALLRLHHRKVYTGDGYREPVVAAAAEVVAV